MKAKDIMTADVITVSPETSVSEIAALLINKRISGVPVVDAEGRVLGIVSEGDLMRRPESGTEPHHSWWLRLFETSEEHAAEFVKSHGLRAEDVMTREVLTVFEDTPVSEIAAILERRHIKRVPVVRDGALVGIVSRANLLQGLATHRAVAPTAPSAGDSTIRERVLEVLDREFPARTEFIDLTVTGGTVNIWGAAESPEEKRAIRVAAETVPGVKAVTDHIGVLPPNVRSLIWAE